MPDGDRHDYDAVTNVSPRPVYQEMEAAKTGNKRSSDNPLYGEMESVKTGTKKASENPLYE